MNDPMTEHLQEPLPPEIARIVNRTSIVTMAIAAVLSPVPLADELVFVPVFGFMAVRIGKRRNLAPRDMPWRPIAATMLAALGARAAVNVTVSYIPGVAAIANAVSAATVTQLLGRYVDGACADPAAAKPLTLKEIGDLIREKLRSRATVP
jgi:uncharacterized protein (DUF697 family)